MNPRTKTIRLGNNISFDMVYVEGGRFMIGDDDSSRKNEKPTHEVVVKSFYIGKFQVTQDIWQMTMDKNPSKFKGERRPMELVSWLEAKEFLQLLNEQTEQCFRLPAEAEWEYAARGGKHNEGYRYAGSDKLKQVAWYSESSNRQTHEVGQLLANELGLYDVSGNVWDDVRTIFTGTLGDGSAWLDSPNRDSRRVLRGGDYFNNAENCRPSYRLWYGPYHRNGNLGIRLVLPLQADG